MQFFNITSLSSQQYSGWKFSVNLGQYIGISAYSTLPHIVHRCPHCSCTRWIACTLARRARWHVTARSDQSQSAVLPRPNSNVISENLQNKMASVEFSNELSPWALSTILLSPSNACSSVIGHSSDWSVISKCCKPTSYDSRLERIYLLWWAATGYSGKEFSTFVIQ